VTPLETAHMGEGLLPVVPYDEALKGKLVNAYIATRTPAPEKSADWASIRRSLECELFAKAVEVILRQHSPDDLPATTPTALPSAEDAVGLVEVLGEHLFTLSAQLKASGFLDSTPHHAVYERVVKAFQALDRAALQSPRASDEVQRNREVVGAEAKDALLNGKCGVPRQHIEYSAECICSHPGTALLLELGLAYRSDRYPQIGIFLTGVGSTLKDRLSMTGNSDNEGPSVEVRAHAWSGDGTRGASDGFDGPICIRCGIPDTGDTPTDMECKP
jgi:hypothetical protein